MYTVLWIDDEFRNFKGFIRKAYNLGLDVTKSSFDNYEEGIEWLKCNKNDCAAIILDVHCKAKKDSAANVDSYSDSLEEISLLCNENNIPRFVWTGGSSQAKEFSDIERWFLKRKAEWASKNYYTKNADDETLLEDILKAISSNPRRRLEKKYSDILSFVGENEREKLLRVMISIAEGDTRNTSCMNEMRQVLEWLTAYLADYGFLPRGSELSEMRHYMVLLNDVGLDEIIPKYIRYTMQACENATQEGSHNSTKDGIRVTSAVETGQAPYLIESTLNNVLTILHWAKLLPTDETGKKKILDTVKPHIAREEGKLQYNLYCDFYYVNDCKLDYNSYKGDLSEAVGMQTLVYNKVRNKRKKDYHNEPTYYTKNYDILKEVGNNPTTDEIIDEGIS